MWFVKNPMDNNSKPDRLLLADGHVHIYPRFNLESLLNEALQNFKEVSAQQSVKSPWTAFLFLTETKEDNWFSLLKQQTTENKGFPSPGFGKWIFRQTQEECSLYGRSNEEEGLVLIAGRQIKAESNLEVLALGTIESFEEGRPVRELIHTISQKGAIPVIPWGAGKWLGARGQMIKQLLLNQDGPLFFLGDTRNRPVFWLKSSIFKRAAHQGLKTLPGSDPLPLSSQEKFPGSYGFRLKGDIKADYPFASIKKLLFDPETLVIPYGKGERSFRFFRDQVRLRITAGK
jgi:hypothetical protein